jgi:hypothetical protein
MKRSKKDIPINDESIVRTNLFIKDNFSLHKMKNYRGTNDFIELDLNNVIPIQDLSYVDISEAFMKINALKIHRYDKNYLIDPSSIIFYFNDMVNSSTINIPVELTFSGLILNNGLYHLEFLKHVQYNYNVGDKIPLMILINGKRKKGFFVEIISTTLNTFTTDAKMLNDIYDDITQERCIYQTMNQVTSYDLDYSELFILSISAIQKLNQKIQDLESRLNALN